MFEGVVSSEFTVIEKEEKFNCHSSRRFVSEPVFGKEEAKIIKVIENKGMGGVYLPRDMGTFLLYVDGQSFGALGESAWMAFYRVTQKMGILFSSGKGELPPSLKDPSPHLVKQVASGRFGIKTYALDGDDFVDYFKNAQFIEIKIGQGAKPARGGRLPDEKMTANISMTCGVDEGTSALSPPSHHDTYSIEDIKKLIELMKTITSEHVRVIVKIAATNDLEQIVSGLVKRSANAINISGGEGGTGSATRESNQTGMPLLRAIGRAHERLMTEITTSEKEFLEKLPPNCDNRVEPYITSLGLIAKNSESRVLFGDICFIMVGDPEKKLKGGGRDPDVEDGGLLDFHEGGKHAT